MPELSPKMIAIVGIFAAVFGCKERSTNSPGLESSALAAEVSSGPESEARDFLRYIFSAHLETRLRWVRDSTEYPDEPNREESVCFRVGRYFDAVITFDLLASTLKEKHPNPQGVIAQIAAASGKLRETSRKEVSRLCGPIASTDDGGPSASPEVAVDLSSSDKVQVWVSEKVEPMLAKFIYAEAPLRSVLGVP